MKAINSTPLHKSSIKKHIPKEVFSFNSVIHIQAELKKRNFHLEKKKEKEKGEDTMANNKS
jgi:hypothetical protein